MSSLRLAFAGDRHISVRVLEFLLQQECRPLALLVPEPGRATHDRQLMDLCGFLPKRRVIRGRRFGDSDGASLLRSLDLDFILGVHYPYVIPESVLTIPRSGVLNLHPALLPCTRGWHTPSWAILEQCPYGATLHFMDSGVDTGDIVHQKEIEVSECDTADSLYQRVLAAEFEVFAEAWPSLKDGTYRRFPQPRDGAPAHRKRDLFRDEIQRLDLDAPVKTADLLRRLRALTTNRVDEAAYFELDGRRHRVQVIITEDPAQVDGTATPAAFNEAMAGWITSNQPCACGGR